MDEQTIGGLWLDDGWCHHPGDDYILVNAGDVPEKHRGDTDAFIELARPKVRICPLCGLRKFPKDTDT